MRSLAEFPAAERAAVRCILTDIDDTLTSDGRLPSVAYQAVQRLHEAGFVVVPVTGRPAGWCDLIARLWPVDAVVGENGAFYFRCTKAGMKRVYWQTASERAASRERLRQIERKVLAAVPRARVAADQPYRESDLAIDFAEDGPVLSEEEIDRIVACFEQAGATAKISSIHVNGWFGAFDKLTMTKRLFTDIFDMDIAAHNDRFVFVGDSPNDEPMFGFFRNSIAVANFEAFASRVARKPRWITRGPGGDGFAEVADALIEARQ